MALPAEVEAAFQLSPGLRNRLDEGALKILARADPERAVQVLNDLAAKTDVRNPSAFVAATLAKNAPRHSQAVPPASLSQARTIQEVIQRFPELDKVLDESARRRLAEVDFGRATELIEELAGRSDVRNPSAFVVHALGRSQATQPNANALPAVQAVQARLAGPETVLDAFPAIAQQLDARAQQRILEVDPERARGILGDIIYRGDVHNPSAFVMKALSITRDRPPAAPVAPLVTLPDWAQLAAQPGVQLAAQLQLQGLQNLQLLGFQGLDVPRDEVGQLLARFPHLQQRLDNQALRKMAESDPVRVQEIVEELDIRTDVRNPSAFVVKALVDFPTSRKSSPAPVLSVDPVHRLLAMYPQLQLDQAALNSLEACAPERALEVLEDLVTKRDVRNPSAFVAASLAKQQTPRNLRAVEAEWRPWDAPATAAPVAPSRRPIGMAPDQPLPTSSFQDEVPLAFVVLTNYHTFHKAMAGVLFGLILTLPAFVLGEGNMRGSNTKFMDLEYFSHREVDAALTAEMADVEKIRALEKALEPTFQALPKQNGLLSHHVVRYVLHRYFLHNRGWLVKGLEPEGAYKTQPDRIRQDWESWVPAYLEKRLEAEGAGMGLRDLAEMVAAIEALVRTESHKQLAKVYESLNFPLTEPLTRADAEVAMDMYLVVVLTARNITMADAPKNRKRIMAFQKRYNGYGEMKSWLEDLEKRHFHSDAQGLYNFSSVGDAAEAFGYEFPSFNDKECKDLKTTLISMEGGSRKAGRIPLSDFYNGTKYMHWKFTESPDYLRDLGALDEADPTRKYVILSNYISSFNNCIRADSLYAICCRSQCEPLMNSLEQQVGAPEADPETLARLVAKLSTDTMPARGTLDLKLLDRLGALAQNGKVPLHGRLFAQWMHHAFPRECPYPHEAGTTNPQTPDEWMKSNGRSTKVSQEQIEQIARDTCPAVLQEGAPIHCKTEDADLPWSSSEDRAPMLSLAGAQAKHVSDQDMAQENWEPPRMLWLAVLPSLVLFMFLFDRLLRRRSYASLIPAFVLIIVTLACTCVGIIDVRAAMGAGIAFFLWRFFVVPFTSFSIKDKLAESPRRERPPLRDSPVQEALAFHQHLADSIDADARRKLESIDPSRAVEIIEDVARRTDVRNPSAFVIKAATAYPAPRIEQRDQPEQHAYVDAVEQLVARYPRLRADLDEDAMARLREVDLDRAEEIIEDVAHKGHINNPSAFIVKAVASSSVRRTRDDLVEQRRARSPEPNGFHEERRSRGEEDNVESRASRAGLAVACASQKCDRARMMTP
ncbi:unnamed protein product [Effrenium voratum]|nr:unnamed protein product [Effrenium voratum]